MDVLTPMMKMMGCGPRCQDKEFDMYFIFQGSNTVFQSKNPLHGELMLVMCLACLDGHLLGKSLDG